MISRPGYLIFHLNSLSRDEVSYVAPNTGN
jgi:hypothetical protein